MLPQMPFRFFGSREGSFLTAAEPLAYSYDPDSSLYNASSTALYSKKGAGPRIIEPNPAARHTTTTASKTAAAAAEPAPLQAEGECRPKGDSCPSSAASSTSGSPPRRPVGFDLMYSAARMNGFRMMG